ncbi:MAG TPA: glycosyl hydrolase family 28 protein [Phycisphaerae bacterium]|nr:glycosyl hydrolase family 28 protein [Phycisphaerae bacterium]
MRIRTLASLLTLAAVNAAAMAQATAPAPPAPPANSINIKDAGAVADGKTLNTEIIQKAIDDLAARGGGTLLIPAVKPVPADAPAPIPQVNGAEVLDGAFLSGALFLKPGVNVHIEKGAILKGSTDIKQFPITETRIEGKVQQWVPALINAVDCKNLKIDGEGILDGSGTPYYAAFRNAGREGRGTKNLDTPRPRLLFISKSDNVTISGLHLFNSGFWNLHLYRATNVTIDGLDIQAPRGSPSTDGIDVDSSQWITIKNTSISNNDDCIAIKGSKGQDARDDKDSPPDEHIFITNCLFKMGGSVVTCGSEATFVRDVKVENCTVAGPNSGGITVLRLKLRTDTPQTYEDIHINNITLDGVGTLIGVAPWSQYETLQGRPKPAHTVRNISLTNIKGTFGNFGSVSPAIPADVIERITLENIDLKFTNNGTPRLQAVKELTVKNVKINGSEYVPPAAPQAPTPATQQ